MVIFNTESSTIGCSNFGQIYCGSSVRTLLGGKFGNSVTKFNSEVIETYHKCHRLNCHDFACVASGPFD